MKTSLKSAPALRIILLALALIPTTSAFGQAPHPDPTPSPQATNTVCTRVCKGNFLKNIWCDQKAIWTSPAELDRDDARWLVPLGLTTAGLMATDRRTAGSLSENRTRLRISNGISQAGSSYGLGAFVTATYLIGRGTSNRRLRQTGELAAEALIDAAIVTFAFKKITQRPRPREDGGRGRFFTGGNSHPSGHSAAAWSVATVFACKYKDRPLIHYGAYAAAGAVGISRFTARKHFLSDILVGSALGYGVGRYVCRMGKLRDATSGETSEYKRSKLLPVNVGARFDRRMRDYGVALSWSF